MGYPLAAVAVLVTLMAALICATLFRTRAGLHAPGALTRVAVVGFFFYLRSALYYFQRFFAIACKIAKLAL